jgi:hypothetical protein
VTTILIGVDATARSEDAPARGAATGLTDLFSTHAARRGDGLGRAAAPARGRARPFSATPAS